MFYLFNFTEFCRGTEDCFTLYKTPQGKGILTFFPSIKGGDPYPGDTLFQGHSQFLCYTEQIRSFLVQLEGIQPPSFSRPLLSSATEL